MWNFQMSNVHCLVCNVQFSQSDVRVMEQVELEMPVCDMCVCSLYEYRVRYNGSEDLLAFLKSEVKDRRCMSCLEAALVLDRIKLGSLVEGIIHCKNCNKENEIDIHIEFV